MFINKLLQLKIDECDKEIHLLSNQLAFYLTKLQTKEFRFISPMDITATHEELRKYVTLKAKFIERKHYVQDIYKESV